jgi:hypothetical protein
VTFSEYPPAGWIGWCTDVCTNNGVTARSVLLDYDYDASVYYFVYYVTNDAGESMDGLSDEAREWYEAKFPWTVSAQALPSADTMTGLLTAIGAYNSAVELTVTLLYRAAVDLDLHFECDDGAEIYYGATSVESCGATLDKDD